MPPENSDPTYDVGFAKPPKHGRFRKGVSGNPKGRPKGKSNIATVLDKTLHEKVVINENGERKTVTKLEAAVKQLVNKAASGDLAAMRQLSALASVKVAETAEVENINTVSEADQKVMSRLMEKILESKKESHENSDS